MRLRCSGFQVNSKLKTETRNTYVSSPLDLFEQPARDFFQQPASLELRDTTALPAVSYGCADGIVVGVRDQ